MADDLISQLMLAGESKSLDYKRAMVWDPNDKSSCCELVKDILAMANTQGGYLLIGVDELPTGPVATGLNEQQLKTWDTTKVNQFLSSYAEPDINVLVHKREYQGHHLVIIQIPHFESTLHICRKDFPGVLRRPAIYVRTSNNESAEVSSVGDVNQLIERSIRNRSDQLLTQFRSLLTGADTEGSPRDEEQFSHQYEDAQTAFSECLPEDVDPRTGYLQYSAWPAQFEKERYTISQLKRASQDANVNFRNWTNPLLSGYGEEPIALQDGLQMCLVGRTQRNYFWRLHSSGLVFSQQTIADDVDLDGFYGRHEPGGILGLPRLMATVAMGIHNFTTVYGTLGLTDEDVTFQFKILNTDGRQLRVPYNWRMIDDHLFSRIATIHSRHTTSIEEWTSNPIELAKQVTDDLVLRFNAHDPFYPDKDIREVFGR